MLVPNGSTEGIQTVPFLLWYYFWFVISRVENVYLPCPGTGELDRHVAGPAGSLCHC